MTIIQKDFSNGLAGSVMDSNNLFFVLFSVKVLFQLTEMFMLLSCLSIISSLYVQKVHSSFSSSVLHVLFALLR